MRRLILCADDYALSPAVSRTIARLAIAGKLNATGCMTAMPNWPEDARALRDLPEWVEVGLHLTLTLEVPLTSMTVARGGQLPGIDALRRLTHSRSVNLGEIAAEVRAQFDQFTSVMGRAPAFVDAHQHAHALPGIREVVLAETTRLAPAAWVRSCVDAPLAILARPYRGKALASALGSRGLAAAAGERGLTSNHGFAGHYGFAGDYAAVFSHFLRRPGRAHLVMCHPGEGARPGDAIAAARRHEAAALSALPISDLAAQAGLAFPR